MRDAVRLSLWWLVILASASPAAGQEDPQGAEPAYAEPAYEVELERSSHVVRPEEERLRFSYHADKWDFEGLVATLTPSFRDERDQLGLLVARAFDWGELTAVARLTDKSLGEDVTGSVAYRRAGDAGAFGVEVTFGRADLADDDFLVDDGESQFVGRVSWRRAGGLEVLAFGASSATYDLMRATAELLDRLPRSEIVGAETLADLDVDEERLEDSAGVSVGFGGDRFEGHVYVKGGEQKLRGFFEGDDFLGFGGDLKLETRRWTVDAELDLRQIDPPDGFETFDRGRASFDVRHRPGRYEWGVGGYVQGEAESFSEIPDLYDTAGLGLTASRQLASGNRIGFWTMWEDDAPDLQVIARAAFFYRTQKREYGVGVRRDETGPPRFAEERYGPFFVFKLPFRNLVLDGDVGVQDSAYGKLSISFKKR